jgi:phosphoenolpyruvate-protein phosphotransferase (PTS system enzyme I)
MNSNHDMPPPPQPIRANRGGPKQRRIRGTGASEGIAIGKAYILERKRIVVPHRTLEEPELAGEVDRFHQALDRAKENLHGLKASLLAAKSREPAFIIDAHIMMLEDELLIQGAIDLIRGEKINAEWALRRKAADLVAVFSAMQDPYLKERGRDVEEVVERVIGELVGKTASPLGRITEPVIIVAHEITPAETAHMGLDKVIGFATDIGTSTSHAAIVAKSLRIPAVVGCTSVTTQVNHGDTVLIDGHSGMVIVDPSADTLEEYESRRKWLADFRQSLKRYRTLASKTKDGHSIILAANLEIIEENQLLKDSGAEGVGLFRTEYLYLDRDDLPSEDEHFENYRKLVLATQPHSAIIRTLDLGGDKFKSTLSISDELNPAMGLRAIRLCLARPDLFKTQLRAILRASAYGKAAIMFPMISSYREFLQAKAILQEAAGELENANVPFDKDLDVGVMIEVPSAAIMAEDIAEAADFFSIGTNDLIQYTLAIDRINEHVNYLYEPLHPAVIRIIRWVVDAGHAKGIPVQMCGAMAGDPVMLPVLIGLGLDELSMPMSVILRIKRILRSLSRADAAALVEEIVTMKTSLEIKRRVKQEITTKYAEAYALEIEAFEEIEAF